MACVISSASSSSGKTLLSLLLVSWVKSEQNSIQTFKVGPDYLDPQQLSAVSNKACRNLDLILSGKEWVKESFNFFGGSTDFSLVEGVMGLFDGIGPTTKGSTADVARFLGLPIVLILDAQGKASDEATELMEYVADEWKTLRNQCEASNIGVEDEDRRSTEEAIALAGDALKAGRIDESLESLGLADGFMEKLRRRV